MGMRYCITCLRLWLGWDKNSHGASDTNDKIVCRTQLDEIRKKAETFEQRTRELAIETKPVHQIGDTVVTNSKNFPNQGSIVDSVVMDGREILNMPRTSPNPKVVSSYFTDDELLTIGVDGETEESLKKWAFGESLQTRRDQMFNRTDNVVDDTEDEGYPSRVDWLIEVPK